MDYIRKYKPNVAIHIEKVLDEMRTKKQDLLQCLKTIFSHSFPVVLLHLILDYNIVV